MSKVVFEIRFERVLADIVLAILLAPSTLALQKTFSNDLIDPYLLGSLSGAFVAISLGAIILGVQALYEGSSFLLGFLGSVATGTLVALIALKRSPSSALLVGIGISMALQGFASALAYLASATLNRPFLPLLMGTTAFVTRDILEWTYTIALIAFSAFLMLSWKVSVLEYGEDVSKSLRISPRRITTLVLVLSSASSGAAVGCCGIIPFVGLISANVAKRLTPLRPLSEFFLSTLVASCILVFADTLASSVVTEYGTLPVGAFLSVIGGTVLAVIMLKDII